MARKTPQSSLKQISEINLTPLMDLTFILLITFIITFPLIEQGIAVNLPKGKAKELSEEEARTVTVDAQLSTSRAHEIADRIETALRQQLHAQDVTVHVEPEDVASSE